MAQPLANARKPIRFPTEKGTVCGLAFTNGGKEFKKDLACLVINESSKGCCLILHSTEEFKVGMTFWVKIGELDALEVEVRWLRMLEHDVCRMGVVYLDP